MPQNGFGYEANVANKKPNRKSVRISVIRK